MKSTENTISNNASGVLAQVASRARVSAGTVSRVFNNSSLIPAGTRARVLCAARELGFRPRVGVRNKQIALITEPPHKTKMGGYVNTLTQYICYALSKADAGITMITEDRLGNLSDCWFDGLIGIAWEQKTLDVLKNIHNIPIIWFSDNLADSFHTIYFDPVATGRMAGKYFIEKGHRKLAVIHEQDYCGTERANGFAAAMTDAGIDISSNLLRISNTTQPHLAVKQLLDAACTGVWVTGEDLKVLEISWLLQELAGRRIPEDISIMGFENPGISEFMRPSLTTIFCPLQEMAERAVGLVLRDEFPEELYKIELPVTLIERNSVRNI
ncbi:MAG: LacI family DNA-binding transcriptional regulator [Lentisphaeria bacterium]|nr:LacI family DNA-binding transcriptional regulator [Lentisphaeria bacterium]